MSRNELQTSRALRVLLTPMRLGSLWTDEGPTARAVELLEQDGGASSSGERTMVLAGGGIWSGHAPTLRFEALLGLDNANTEALCSLLVVITQGAEAVDAWIARPEARRFPRPT